MVSVFDGVAYINDNCGPYDSECGAGYGNSVKIVGNNGYMAFYAHLSKVLVKSRQVVKQGQAIGVEGATGAVGEEPITLIFGFKHLHFSMHKYEDWGIQYNDEPYPAFSSIPYKLKLKINGVSQVKDVRSLPCDYFSEGILLQGFTHWETMTVPLEMKKPGAKTGLFSMISFSYPNSQGFKNGGKNPKSLIPIS